MSRIIYKYFNDDELLRISNKIKDVERTTSGELVVTIKERRKLTEKGKSVLKLAEREFLSAGIAKTENSTGILIFILLESKEFYILADKSINEKVEQSEWNKISAEMSLQFKNGYFSKGILKGVEKAGKILSKHFPITPDDINELPNKVRVKS